MDTELKLYNSMTNTIETFHRSHRQVLIYVCGITPYDTTHLGHIFTYTVMDVLMRFLHSTGYKTKYAQNLTDIDDPILREARENEENWQKLGKKWTQKYISDMKTMNILAPDKYPSATEVIADIIVTVQTLLERGVAYESGGSVYFDINSWEDFGKLSKLPRDEMLPVANERGNDPDDPNKRNPLDFALWKAQKEDEPAWKSPWAKGRPGWHIECSTMATRFLGEQIDIHGGGSDLIFPHHECEIAQSECASGKKPFSRFWFHTAMVRHKGEKMSKSLGNLVMVKDLLEKVSPEGLRLYLLKHHYRKPWEFDENSLKEAQEQVQKWQSIVPQRLSEKSDNNSEIIKFRRQFLQKMYHDVDTPGAIDEMDHICDKIISGALNRKEKNTALFTFVGLSKILGVKVMREPYEEFITQPWDRHLNRILS